MTGDRLDKHRNLAAADEAAKRNSGGEDLTSPVTTCPARQPEIFVIPCRYAMAEDAAKHPDFQPPCPTQSHPMALRRLRRGYVYLWHAQGPLKRYAVAADSLLLEQSLTQPHAELMVGEIAGIALNKRSDAWMLYSEIPLGEQACDLLRSEAGRRKRMRQIALTGVAKNLAAAHCPPLANATELVAEIMPQARDKTLAQDYQQNGAKYREGMKQLGELIYKAPTDDNIKAFAASSQWLREREHAAGAQHPGEPLILPGVWSAQPWELEHVQAWLDAARDQAGALHGVFAALDDDLGVLRDVDHEQSQIEAEHEDWVADNSARQTVGSFIRSMLTEDGAEVANLLNYRYRERDLQLTAEQGDTLLDSQKALYALLAEESRINQQRGRQYGHAQADALLAQVRSQEQSVLNRVRGFIPTDLHNEAQQVVLEYREEKISYQEGGRGAEMLAEYIDLPSMNHWLDHEAPKHFKKVETRHQLLYADRLSYLRRHESGTWFVDRGREDHLQWLDSLAIACLSAQCSRSEGAKQFADYVRSDDPGLLRLVFHAWSPTLEAAVNNTSRLNELATALSTDNLANARAAVAKTLDDETLRSLERLAGNLEGAWAATMTRLSGALIQSGSGIGPSMGLFLVMRLGEDTRLVHGLENSLKVWRLFGQKAEALTHWAQDMAKAIRHGNVNGIVDSPTVKAAGGLLPLAALVVNLLNAGSYAGQASVLEGGDERRQAESLSAYLYAGAALGAVIQNWMILGKGIDELTGRLPTGQLATAPTLTLFGSIVGGISAFAAFNEWMSLYSQIENTQGRIDPWLELKKLVVSGQVAVFLAQGLLGLSLTALRLANRITTPVAIVRFRLGVSPIHLILLALGLFYLLFSSLQRTPFQNFLANCSWSHHRANVRVPLDPQAELDEIDQLFVLLYQPRLTMEIQEVRIRGSLGDTITQDGISRLIIDLPGAAPGAAQLDLTMSGNPTPQSAAFGTGTQGSSTDLGAIWLESSRCTWIPADAGQGLRLSGCFPTPLTRLTLRLRYLSPVALLAGVGTTIGGARGLDYTLAPNGGVLSPYGEIISLRPKEPTSELDRATSHRLGPYDNSRYLTPEEQA